MRTLLLFFLLLSSVSYSQVITSDGSYPMVIKSDFYSTGALKFEEIFDHEDYSELGIYTTTKYTEYYENGQLRLQLNLEDSKLHGPLVAYWKNGNLKRKDLYNNGKLVEGKVWDENEKEIEYFEFVIPSNVTEN